MKAIIISFIFVMSSLILKAQNPVSWNYNAKKVADKTFEMHITATIQNGWHLYSQTQPEEAIAVPTTIKFNNNPLLTIRGKIKEVGKIEKYHDTTLGIEQWQYSNKVDFVQQLKLKANVKTNVSGSIEFQVCTNEKCLPAATINFTIALK